VAKRRGRIGFLVDSVEGSYQSSVLSGVLDAARAAEVDVLCFCGGVLAAPDDRADQRNSVYQLVDSYSVDGVVVMAGAIGNVVGVAEVGAFCASFRPMPVISIAAALDGIPSVIVDDDAGMRDAVTHAIRVHNRKNFAFIRGPEANQEAERRYHVYCDVLVEHGLTARPESVVRGAFDRASGEESIAVLLDGRSGRKVEVDAVVAASDEMAIGATRALLARGVRVPEDVAVIGFDDVEAARFCFPPLTTVRQPLYRQGRVAAELLVGELRGERAPERVVLHTELVTRRSCGCGPAIGGAAYDEPSRDEPPPLLDDPRGEIAADVASAFGPAASPADARACARIISALAAELGGAPGEFLRILEEALRSRLETGEPAGPWQDALGVLRRAALRGAKPAQRASIEELVHAARALAGRYAELAQADQRARTEAVARMLNETSGALATSFDRAALVATLSRHLPRLGIDRAYVAAYRDPASKPRTSRLLFAVDAERDDPIPAASYPSRWLVPEGTLPERRLDFVVQPLFFEDEAIGVVLLEIGPRKGRIYETLRDQISAALQGSQLVQRVIEHDRNAHRLLRYVLDVTPDMQRVQPLADLYPKILSHSIAMVEPVRDPSPGRDSYLPPAPSAGLLATTEGACTVVRASTDDGQLQRPIEECLGAAQLERVRVAIEGCAVDVGDRSAIIPLRAGEATTAVVYLDCAVSSLPDVELLSTFANQAAAAIRSAQLYELAALDSLTGAHTRRFFDDWLLREVKAARQAPACLSLLMIDMDGMKRINDSAGHLAGDQALAAVGKALRESTRPTDLVGRFGGDEFVVLLPRTGARAAERVAQRMIDTLSRRDVEPPARISIGCSTLPARAASPSESPSPEEMTRTVQTLLKHADEALYRAKRQGGMRVCAGRASVWERERVAER
jgi:diguanylate cyclase (GGDEF)-like protein